MKEIHGLIQKNDLETGKGSSATADILTPYKDFITENIKLSKPLKVGIDAGNGTGGVLAVPILKSLGCEVFDIFCDMDGTFPNHGGRPHG